MFGKEDKKATGDVVGFIGKGIFIEGKMGFEETVRIEGNFKGEINAMGVLVVGEGGYVEGNIKVDSAIITGEVNGVLEAATRVEMRSPGKVIGTIITPNLIIGEGVIFEGNCLMKKKDQAEPEVVDYPAEQK